MFSLEYIMICAHIYLDQLVYPVDVGVLCVRLHAGQHFRQFTVHLTLQLRL